MKKIIACLFSVYVLYRTADGALVSGWNTIDLSAALPDGIEQVEVSSGTLADVAKYDLTTLYVKDGVVYQRQTVYTPQAKDVPISH